MKISILHSHQQFSIPLLAWYDIHKRDLPWRRTSNPYHIWISEIMLQQTKVDTVIPYFLQFIDKFPTIQSLAQASEEEVLKLWQGLGYYARARNLHRAAKEVQDKYNGIVPSDKHQLATLRGIGPYTRGAILSIAYQQTEPAVDGNVMRVLARFYRIEEDITQQRTRVYIEQLVTELMIANRAGDFTQALMEIGATVCTPKTPHCLICPVMAHCQSRLAGIESSLPLKKKAKPARIERRLVALIERQSLQPAWLFRQRPQQGLLAKMWEMPHIELHSSQWLTDAEHIALLYQYLIEEEAIAVQKSAAPIPNDVMDIEHQFSHIHWHLKIYRFTVSTDWHPYHYEWLDERNITQYPLPQVFVHIMKQYQHHHNYK